MTPASLPKVELHLHLEGAAPPAFIRRLRRKRASTSAPSSTPTATTPSAPLATRGVTLELCPGSNLALGLYPGWPAHPIADLAAIDEATARAAFVSPADRTAILNRLGAS